MTERALHDAHVQAWKQEQWVRRSMPHIHDALRRLRIRNPDLFDERISVKVMFHD